MIDFLEYNKENLILKEIDENHISIKYNENGNIIPLTFKTPLTKVPFGIETVKNNFILKIELTNYKNNIIMEQFYNFIQELENNIKEYIENKNNKSIISQIRTHVKYDPILTLKLLQNRNKINGGGHTNAAQGSAGPAP